MVCGRKAQNYLLWNAVGFAFVAICAELTAVCYCYWVEEGIAHSNIKGVYYDTLEYSYGLYGGSQRRYNSSGSTVVMTPVHYNDLNIVCDAKRGYCMMSYFPTNSQRRQDLWDMYSYDSAPNQLIPYSTWVAAVTLLAFGGISGAVAVAFGSLKALHCVVPYCTTFYSLYAWNSAAGIFLLVVLGITGSMYKRVPLRDYVDGDYAGAIANIGFSYWFVLFSLVSYVISIILIAVMHGCQKRYTRIQKSNMMEMTEIGSTSL